MIGIAAWIAVFRHDPTSERALFAALLVTYFVHQIEEHLWPGGFRQFTDAHMFHSGNDNWPVDIDGVALVVAVATCAQVVSGFGFALIAIRAQEAAGIDIISDGEIRRESYSNRDRKSVV